MSETSKHRNLCKAINMLYHTVLLAVYILWHFVQSTVFSVKVVLVHV